MAPARPSAAATLRSRVRAEMTEEIKRTARRHVAESGAANLSLRAVARDIGVVSSAIYRYFASRDELLTALIIDAYNSLGEAVEAAEATIDRAHLLDRFTAACHGIRRWAVANPHEYALIYGSPVPGYAAPTDTIGPANRPAAVLARILADGVAAGVLGPEPGEWLPDSVHQELGQLAEQMCPGVGAPVLARGMVAWTEIFGAISFDLFGRLTSVVHDREAWFEHQVRVMTKLVGLSP